MKNFKYAIRNKYFDDENSVCVWANTYPFKIDYDFKEDTLTEFQKNELCEVFGLKKPKPISKGVVDLVFNTFPKFETNKYYKMSVGFVKIEDSYRLNGSWYEVSTNNSGEVGVVDSGDVTDGALTRVQHIDLFLSRLVELFYKKLIKNDVNLEKQLISSHLVKDEFELSQYLYVIPQDQNYKFIVKIKQVNNKFVYDEVRVDLDGQEDFCDSFKWVGEFNELLEIIEDVNKNIEEFARSEIEEWLKDKKAKVFDENENENEDEKWTVEDFETTQNDEDYFRFTVKRDYQVSSEKYQITIEADIEFSYGELYVVESGKSEWEYSEYFDIDNSIKSKKSNVILEDFDKKTQKALQEHYLESLESYIMSDYSGGKTIKEYSNRWEIED